jgi:hypothetical protein
VKVLPKLVGSTKEGVLMASRGTGSEGNSFVFPQIELVAGEGEGDGLLEMSFCLVRESLRFSSPAPDDLLLERLVVPFSFTTDRARIEQANALKGKLQHYCSIVDVYESEEKKINTAMSACFSNIEQLINSTSRFIHSSMPSSASSDKLDDGFLKDLLRELERTKRGLERKSRDCRPAVKKSNDPDPFLLAGYEAETAGQVVDLATVDDASDAEVISWAAAQFINAIVVSNRRTGDALYRKGVKVMTVDLIVPFKVEDRRDGGQR